MVIVWAIIGMALHTVFCLTDTNKGRWEAGWIMKDGTWILALIPAAFIGPLYLIVIAIIHLID